jgi:hypothetical protein
VREQYLVVAERIRQELADIDTVVVRARQAIEASTQLPEYQDHFISSAALSLHDFYSGLERVFQLIASVVDRARPSGSQWHRELLRQMAVELPPVRPRVVSPDSAARLMEYLSFRHVVRNVYAFQFEPQRIERLVENLPATFQRIRSELESFASILEQLNGSR